MFAKELDEREEKRKGNEWDVEVVDPPCSAIHASLISEPASCKHFRRTPLLSTSSHHPHPLPSITIPHLTNPYLALVVCTVGSNTVVKGNHYTRRGSERGCSTHLSTLLSSSFHGALHPKGKAGEVKKKEEKDRVYWLIDDPPAIDGVCGGSNTLSTWIKRL